MRMPVISEESRPSFESVSDLQRLDEASDQYQKVRNTLRLGMKSVDRQVNVSAVYSCTHESAFGASRLRAFEKMAEITKSAKSKANVRYGWYGAEPRRLESIITRGFGLEDAVCRIYGAGIYFSSQDLPDLSACVTRPDPDGQYHLLLCQVILGTPEKIPKGSRQYAPSMVRFDNGTDDLRKPRCLVVWSTNMSTHIIPRYVVSFKVSQRTRERWRRFQWGQALRIWRHPIQTPLRSPQDLHLHRPRYLERYHRIKSHLAREEYSDFFDT